MLAAKYPELIISSLIGCWSTTVQFTSSSICQHLSFPIPYSLFGVQHLLSKLNIPPRFCLACPVDCTLAHISNFVTHFVLIPMRFILKAIIFPGALIKRNFRMKHVVDTELLGLCLPSVDTLVHTIQPWRPASMATPRLTSIARAPLSLEDDIPIILPERNVGIFRTKCLPAWKIPTNPSGWEVQLFLKLSFMSDLKGINSFIWNQALGPSWIVVTE